MSDLAPEIKLADAVRIVLRAGFVMIFSGCGETADEQQQRGEPGTNRFYASLRLR
jgi:hypothetical protein